MNEQAEKLYNERYEKLIAELDELKRMAKEHKKNAQKSGIHYGHAGDLARALEGIDNARVALK